MIRAYICLGSNLDFPEDQLETAISAIQQIPNTMLILRSEFYVTKPWGDVIDQPNFYNAVVAIDTDLSPINLLRALQNIENEQARVRTIKNGPRTMDCDILLYGNEVINDAPTLIVPHARMKERAFVLAPLIEIAPDLILPTGEKVRDLWMQSDRDSIIDRVKPEIIPQSRKCKA